MGCTYCTGYSICIFFSHLEPTLSPAAVATFWEKFVIIGLTEGLYQNLTHTVSVIIRRYYSE